MVLLGNSPVIFYLGGRYHISFGGRHEKGKTYLKRGNVRKEII
jgi:hypothetical protein